jgi:hypothetical protein
MNIFRRKKKIRKVVFFKDRWTKLSDIINKWFRQNDVNIIAIKQTKGDEDQYISVSIWYENIN